MWTKEGVYVVDKRQWVEQRESCWCGVEESSRKESGEYDGGGGGAKEGVGGDDLAYKSVGRDPYLKGMQTKIETDLV